MKKLFQQSIIFLLAILAGLNTACSSTNPRKESLPSSSVNQSVVSGEAKSLYENIGRDITPADAIELIGTPTQDMEIEIVVWPSQNISIWFDIDGHAQVFAPAFGFTPSPNGGSLDMKFDTTREKELITRYINSNTSKEVVTQQLGENYPSGPKRYMHWDFDNGDRIVLLFSMLFNTNTEEWEYDSYEVLNLDQAVISGDDREWGFRTFVTNAPEDKWFAVEPRMLWKPE